MYLLNEKTKQNVIRSIQPDEVPEIQIFCVIPKV